MPESHVFTIRINKCNNCDDELAGKPSQVGEEVCTICETGFGEFDEIICHEYESDKEGHSHKKCHLAKVEKARAAQGKRE